MTDTFKGECKIFCAIDKYRTKSKASISGNACEKWKTRQTIWCPPNKTLARRYKLPFHRFFLTRTWLYAAQERRPWPHITHLPSPFFSRAIAFLTLPTLLVVHRQTLCCPPEKTWARHRTLAANPQIVHWSIPWLAVSWNGHKNITGCQTSGSRRGRKIRGRQSTDRLSVKVAALSSQLFVKAVGRFAQMAANGGCHINWWAKCQMGSVGRWRVLTSTSLCWELFPSPVASPVINVAVKNVGHRQLAKGEISSRAPICKR